MMDNKAEKLYDEYRKLADATRVVVQTYKPGQQMQPQSINVNDIIRKEEIRQQLLTEFKDFLEKHLSAEEMFEIENG